MRSSSFASKKPCRPPEKGAAKVHVIWSFQIADRNRSAPRKDRDPPAPEILCRKNSRQKTQIARKIGYCGLAYVRIPSELKKAMFLFWTPGSSFVDMRYRRCRFSSEKRDPRWSAGHAPESTFVGRAKRALALLLCDRHVTGVHSDGLLIGRTD